MKRCGILICGYVSDLKISTSSIQYVYESINVTCVCIFHYVEAVKVDAVEMQFGKGTMSKHGLTIRRKSNKNA